MHGDLKQRGKRKNANTLVNIKPRLPLLLCHKGKKMPIAVESTTREQYSIQHPYHNYQFMCNVSLC